MTSTSQVIRTSCRALTAAGWTLSAACSPLTATIGYEEPADVLAPEQDAAPGLDAGEWPGGDPDGPHDAALAIDEDARAAVRCWHLPDVVNPHNEAGIEKVEEGDVSGFTDKALACDAGGMNVVTPTPAPGTPRNDPVPVTYERSDGMPLMRGGKPYSLTIPGTTFVGIAGFAGPRCEQAPLTALILTFNLTTGPCVDVNPLLDAQGLRLNLTEQTLLPMGSTLCDANCKDVPRP